MTNQPHAMAISNEDLMSVAYDDDTLSPEEREHLAQCPVCQQQLATYTQTNTRLRTQLYRSVCPSAVDLNYYCLGVVPEEQRTAIASHSLDCPACADDIALIRRQQAAFDPFAPATFSLRTAIRRLVATLVVQQAQPVLREHPATGGWPRQYRAESIDLSLHLSHDGNSDIMLLGIITSSNDAETVNAFEGMTVELFRSASVQTEDATPFLTTLVDDVGNILLEPVPAGTYVMILHLPGRDVVIEELNIH
ncbi:MAG TPA: zf-HC2 domain-containing protein [Ktedonobacteraceae bacterium]|nr:zf-HC2 domain-containing protein [Ktedonobacteraceae bacterium]